MENRKQTFIIAEIGQAHEGSLGIAHSYIDAAAAAGVDAVKFQTHIAQAESSAFEPFRVKFSYEDATRYDYWQRMEFTPEQWAGLKQHCDDKGVEFISSPFSNAAVNLLEQLGVKRYKIGSGEVGNLLMLDRIARTGKPILLSSGMSDWAELESTISFLKPAGNSLTLLQCTTAYPTRPEQWGVQLIPEMRRRFGLPVGFSDHSGDIFACLAATALGAVVLEFHIVFDKRMFGPDTPASMTVEQVETLVKGVRDIEQSLHSSVSKEDTSSFNELRQIFGKSLAVNKTLPSGHQLGLDDLEAKKPGNRGIAAARFREVIGKPLQRPMEAWEFITEADI